MPFAAGVLAWIAGPWSRVAPRWIALAGISIDLAIAITLWAHAGSASDARWLAEVFEPAVNAVPPELHGKRQAAEVFHEILEHRWYLSQTSGSDVGLDQAIESYLAGVLPEASEERAVLEDEL